MPWSGQPSARLRRRRRKSILFRASCAVMMCFGAIVLGVLLYRVVEQGLPHLSGAFLNNFPSRFPEKAGIHSALWGTLWLVGLTGLISIPLGVAAAVYLEEYGRKGKISTFIEINITNLAGVPSVVYGILGMVVFVKWLGRGETLIAGALTMSLLILPIIITASREALRAVPGSLRQAAYAVGATRWQTTRHHVLPAALPGILTGVILSISRAIGETAPLILVGAAAAILYLPEGINSEYSALPIQIYDWATRPQAAFHDLAAAAIIVLLAVLLILNTIAIAIRHRYQRKTR